MLAFDTVPPLSLYVHIPWCLQKCPYCDFNSHESDGALPEQAYVDALLRDLEAELPLIWGRPVETVFIGGGTPSLLSAEAMGRLLSGIRARVTVPALSEITLEANPGTFEQARFSAYRELGINRLSVGVQSLDDSALKRLGRVHGAAEARRAVTAAREAGFDSLNVDLMFALPGQDAEAAARDLREAIALEPDHLSYYQLTLEPNTYFHARPPGDLPADDAAWDMQAAGERMLADAGFAQYEVSAYARPKRRCLHNLNYWGFGDYVGIGAGAHGKLTFAGHGEVQRRWRPRQPAAYMQAAGDPEAIGTKDLGPGDLVIEFMLNALRLTEGFEASLFAERTGLPLHVLRRPLAQAEEQGLLERSPTHIRPTELGRRHLNALLQQFMLDDERLARDLRASRLNIVSLDG